MEWRNLRNANWNEYKYVMLECGSSGAALDLETCIYRLLLLL